MANDLVLAPPATMLSLPDFLARSVLRLGEVKWPGQPVRKYLAGGSSLTSSQKAEAERKADELRSAISGAGDDNTKARAILLMRIIRAGGGGAPTELGIEAKALAYRDAVDDMPAWAIAEAARCWNRGECGDHNYSFPPAPAILREIVMRILEPYKTALDNVEAVLTALTFDRAMDETPIKSPQIPHLKAV